MSRLRIVFCLLVLACVARAEHDLTKEPRPLYLGPGLSMDLNTCTFSRPPFARTAPAPAPGLPTPAPAPRKKFECPKDCPLKADREGQDLACKFTAVWDDIIDTVARAAPNECFALLAACETFATRQMGQPDNIAKDKCEFVSYGTGACDLKAPSPDPKCIGTQGGPLTWYYDRNLQICVSYQNVGSCDAIGPFGSLKDCQKAVSDKKCQ